MLSTTTDPRPSFAMTVTTTRDVMHNVTADDLHRPTPCPDLPVGAMLGHLVTVLRRVAALGRGQSAFEVTEATVTGPSEAITEWDAAARDVHAVWSDASLLDADVPLPWDDETSGRDVLGIFLNEIMVHTCDVAVATGQHPEWDDVALGFAFAAIQIQMPAGDRRADFERIVADLPPENGPYLPPFADAIDVPADAPLIDRLLGWNGRDPDWSPLDC